MRTKDFSIWCAMAAVLLAAGTLSVAKAMQEGRGKAQKEVEQVVVKAYIQGIHGTQDEGQVKSGFHGSFRMLVPDGEGIRPVSVDEWLEVIEDSKQKNSA